VPRARPVHRPQLCAPVHSTQGSMATFAAATRSAAVAESAGVAARRGAAAPRAAAAASNASRALAPSSSSRCPAAASVALGSARGGGGGAGAGARRGLAVRAAVAEAGENESSMFTVGRKEAGNDGYEDFEDENVIPRSAQTKPPLPSHPRFRASPLPSPRVFSSPLYEDQAKSRVLSVEP